ncbi:hypothetical protein [Phenylobacterium sp.]|jgi:hypothetical protein|uniref:hypothetical protein n=1 Tax=Phenylobacterium sp. TaxID=1871053 RepID=UPI002F4135B7
MQWLKSAGSFLLGAAFLALMLFVGVVMFRGFSWLFIHAYPWIVKIETILFAACVFVLPLSIFNKTRMISASVLLLSANVFWLGLWMLGLLIVYHLWGLVGAVLGLALGGVGVVPLAAIAALTKGEWTLLGSLGSSFVVALMANVIGGLLATWHDRQTRQA